MIASAQNKRDEILAALHRPPVVPPETWEQARQ